MKLILPTTVKNYNILALADANGIEMVPMERVRIREVSGRRHGANLQDAWMSSVDRPSVMTFHMTCDDAQYCKQLTLAMKTTPDHFKNMFQLDYVIRTSRPAKKYEEVHTVPVRVISGVVSDRGQHLK